MGVAHTMGLNGGMEQLWELGKRGGCRGEGKKNVGINAPIWVVWGQCICGLTAPLSWGKGSRCVGGRGEEGTHTRVCTRGCCVGLVVEV